MLALLKTVLTVFVFLVQFSSGAVIKRNGSPPYYPWWPWHSWPPPAHHTYGVPTSTRASILSPLSTATRFFPFPTTTSSHDDDSFTSFFPVETEVASACPSSADGIAVTSSTAPTVTISPTRATSTKVPSTIQTTTVKPQSTQPTTLSPATTTSKAPSSSSASGDFWKPTAGVTWQIQIFGTVDTSIAADVYDVDLFDTPASTIATLHAAGRKVICYFSAGSYEDWRSDQSSFQASDKGSAMQGWQGEWWLNTNSANVRSIMAKRIEMAVSKGCDAVDPDNVDGYANANGIDIQEADAVDYLNFLASNAHSRGIAIGLKNAGGLINSVLPVMQFAVNEQCEQFNECSVSKPFIDAGKPVFHIEYPDGAPNISPEAKIASCSVPAASGFSTVLKTNYLSAWVDPC